jgi:hypothetical protein
MKLFDQEEALILVRLLITHLLADFVFQPGSWVNDKRNKGFRSTAYYKHLAVVGAMAFIGTGQWNIKGMGVVLFITLTHAIIDMWKIKTDKNNGLSYFIADQVAHLFVLLLSWLYLIQGWLKTSEVAQDIWNSFPALLITLGYLFCIVPSSLIIRLATKEMIRQDQEGNVKRGGRLIGIFERIIIFTFVLFQQYEAIGFLVTGKSILRFGEMQKKETEYILVGTMISYALAILAGVIVNLLR